MYNTNEMDWNEVGSAINTGSSSNENTTNDKSVFLKLKAGFHHLRIVPTGNSLKKTFFVKLMQHPVKVPKDDGSGTMDQFVLCWSYILDDLMKLKDDPVAQKTKSFVSYLGSIKAITQDDFTKYQTYGCPFCKAFNRLNEMGADNETKNKFYPKQQFFFNAIWRKTTFAGQPATGDDEVYIWRTSKTMAGTIIGTIQAMMQQGGINYIDVNTGRDVLLQATGEKLARRYPTCQFVDRGTPLNLGERIPHNLLDVLSTSHKEYQKAVNYLKASFGEVLKNYGHVIAGDEALTAVYANAVQAVNMANQAIAGNQESKILAQKTTEVANQWNQQQVVNDSNPHIPAPQPAWLPGDEMIEQGGKLVNKRTGQVMF